MPSQNSYLVPWYSGFLESAEMKVYISGNIHVLKRTVIRVSDKTSCEEKKLTPDVIVALFLGQPKTIKPTSQHVHCAPIQGMTGMPRPKNIFCIFTATAAFSSLISSGVRGIFLSLSCLDQRLAAKELRNKWHLALSPVPTHRLSTPPLCHD